MTSATKRRTRRKNAFTLQQLIGRFGDNSAAVEAAKDTIRAWNTEDDWYDTTIREWGEALDAIGFEGAEIQFSGFWSQGDGASFTSGVDLGKLVRFMVSEIDETSDYVWAFKAIRHTPYDGAYVWMWHVLQQDEFDGMICAKVDRTSRHYVHKYTCSVEWDMSNAAVVGEPIDALIKEFMEDVERLRLDLCKAIYKALADEWDYLTSDEAILEIAHDNEYLFDEDGDYLP